VFGAAWGSSGVVVDAEPVTDQDEIADAIAAAHDRAAAKRARNTLTEDLYERLEADEAIAEGLFMDLAEITLPLVRHKL
jgi:hypothetical protein